MQLFNQRWFRTDILYSGVFDADIGNYFYKLAENINRALETGALIYP